MFRKILIANRGEIALRVIKTCREMGIKTAAVYSDADIKALHVLEADEAFYLGKSDPGDSYLNIDRIIEAVKKSGAEALHPGYGFLAENSLFAKRCGEEGIVFIGPPSSVISSLGDKVKAREIMQKNGIPVVPGFFEKDIDFDRISREAEKIGYPLVIKAVAGGGGRGMRIVNSSDRLKDALKEASGEARSAFGHGGVFIEKFIISPRHIEFQILADSQGNVIHLMERECSIQRRFQKIIEETPSTAVTPLMREEMGRSAVAAARASGYVNAGTVEFILDGEGNYYFLEVNTRLQVEHPVTEMTTGLDIVKHQIEIASGNRLTLSQDDIKCRGHAIECRIYAEDPENNFAPCPGNITFLKEPSGPGVRLDTGIYSGFSIPYEYDPILSKLITYAERREHNIKRMIRALQDYVVLGVKTTIPFLIDLLKSQQFYRGETFTDFIEAGFHGWEPPYPHIDKALTAYIADEMSAKNRSSGKEFYKEKDISPWSTLGNWKI